MNFNYKEFAMQGNIGFVKNERSHKQAREMKEQANKPKHTGKTWQRNDKRNQWG